MKILLLNQAFYPDVVSTAQHAADLAESLVARGDQVTVIASERGYDNPSRIFPKRETWKGVEIRRIASGRFGKGAKWKRILDFAIFFMSLLWELSRQPSPDAVIAMTTPPLLGFLAALFVKLKGGRLIYWVMDLNPDEAIAAGWLSPRSFPAGLLSWMLRFTLRNSAKIVALDRFMRQRLIEHGAPPGAVEVIPPWSHDGAIRYDVDARNSFRREHGLEGKFVVTYSGNHSPCHPLDTLLEAALSLAADPRFMFCFIGGGAEFGKVKAFAAKHQLANILCLPYQPRERIAGSLGAADLHVVVMGGAFVGIIHPCKIYNILSLGIPVLYIGPKEGHIPDLVPASADWFYAGSHGSSKEVCSLIVQASVQRVTNGAAQRQIGRGFSAAQLLPRLADIVSPAAQPGGARVEFDVARSGGR